MRSAYSTSARVDRVALLEQAVELRQHARRASSRSTASPCSVSAAVVDLDADAQLALEQLHVLVVLAEQLAQERRVAEVELGQRLGRDVAHEALGTSGAEQIVRRGDAPRRCRAGSLPARLREVGTAAAATAHQRRELLDDVAGVVASRRGPW